MIGRLKNRLAAALHDRRRRGAFQRPFDGNTEHRLLILGIDHRIPQSQVYPFHYYFDALRARGVEVREACVETYGDDAAPDGATAVAFQSQFDISQTDFAALVAKIHDRNPGARITYLDWFAPTDLRLAQMATPLVDVYLTKHLLRDRARYGAPTQGDTTLMENYGRAFDLSHDTQHFEVPEGFWPKLHLGPSFVTAPFMLPVFAKGVMPSGPRPIDLHARIAVEGTPWYAAMRGQCADAVDQLENVTTVTGTGIRHDLFLREMRAAKICFSPFGYGEVCWRDYEAVMSGAVLLKQDMAHVETDPDIFVADETYVPVAWDLSDFAEKVAWLRDDSDAREAIATAAFTRLQDYARSDLFVDRMRPLWEVRDGR